MLPPSSWRERGGAAPGLDALCQAEILVQVNKNLVQKDDITQDLDIHENYQKHTKETKFTARNTA